MSGAEKEREGTERIMMAETPVEEAIQALRKRVTDLEAKNMRLRTALLGSPCYVKVNQSGGRLEGVTTQNVYNCVRATCKRCIALAEKT